MVAYIWRYEVHEQHREAFEIAYGPKGDWAELFCRSGGYRGTELMRGEDGAYLTLDVWRSKAEHQSFLTDFRADYDALDRRGAAWTRSEHFLGEFEVIE